MCIIIIAVHIGGDILEQFGKIVEVIDDSTAIVTMVKHTSCKNCGACHIGSKPEMSITVENTVNAKLGNIVEVSMPTQNILSAAFIMYVIPLVMLVAGIGIGTKIFSSLSGGEIFAILLGFALLTVSYLVIRQNEKRFREKYKAVITKIIE